jgi:hypothetical protein
LVQAFPKKWWVDVIVFISNVIMLLTSHWPIIFCARVSSLKMTISETNKYLNFGLNCNFYLMHNFLTNVYHWNKLHVDIFNLLVDLKIFIWSRAVILSFSTNWLWHRKLSVSVTSTTLWH